MLTQQHLSQLRNAELSRQEGIGTKKGSKRSPCSDDNRANMQWLEKRVYMKGSSDILGSYWQAVNCGKPPPELFGGVKLKCVTLINHIREYACLVLFVTNDPQGVLYHFRLAVVCHSTPRRS